MLKLKLARISPTHHRLDVARADGSGESIVLETKSCLEHDFIHLALETEAGLRGAFFGLLDAGHSYAELSGKTAQAMPAGSESRVAEMVIGALTSYVRGEGDATKIVPAIVQYLSMVAEAPPPWLTIDLVTRVKERFRRLSGQWKATAFGDVMAVQFDASA